MVKPALLVGTQDRGGAGPSDARRCAYRVMRRVDNDGAFADRAFRTEAERLALSPRDRAFAQQLAYGTLQRSATLTYVLTALSARPIESIDAPLRDAMMLGLFQLLFLGSVPDHAAVEQTVELAKLERGSGHRFANAVMRRATREARELVEELSDDTPAEAAVRHSHPEWLVRMWWDALGREETLGLLARDNEAPESCVRANSLMLTRDELRDALGSQGVESAPVEGLSDALILAGRFDVHGSDLFDKGALMPQSRASMTVSLVLDPSPGERVLDMCAAPGAKTTHIAALMGEGELVAMERVPGRARALERHVARMGAPWVQIRTGDAAELLAVDPEPLFDRILLDAPCSDLGTLQSRPDARWRKGERQIRKLTETQDELLDAAARRLRPGGTLVYSTCTISPLENEQRVDEFLERHPEFSADDLGAERPDLAHPARPQFLQFLPHRHGTDGFFISRLRREEVTEA
jgi:16S rRNA (cytosine967-C5)-methyltransferase